MEEDFIRRKVHRLYWDLDINCARAVLICLSELFQAEISEQTLQAAIGLHGAGGYRAQCGLVEGALMFTGIYGSQKGLDEEAISGLCFQFAQAFTEKFGSLRCFDLRPGGFTEQDPPHRCEELTAKAVRFSWEFLRNAALLR